MEKEPSVEEIRDMMKLVPAHTIISMKDIIEMFSQNDKQTETI